MQDNIILQSDSYKYSQPCQYPPDTTKIYSYFESRIGSSWPYTVFFGLQAIMQDRLSGRVVTSEKIDEAEEVINAHFGKKIFDRAGWEHILNVHGGRLPIKIKSVLEGSCIPTSNVLFTVENTDPACFWLPSFLETMLSKIWYPCTVATQSREIYKLLKEYAIIIGDVPSIDFKLHDFGYRGVSSEESAGIGGASHLLSFQGTDNIAALMFLKKHYYANMAGYSIPASEHTTMISWDKEHEQDAMKNMLDKFPDGIIACVSDSYNIYNACSEIWGTALKDQVMNRNGTLVVRPDSGNPTHVVMQVLEILGEKFGYTINNKGYKVLDPHVRIIQGDGIDYDTIAKILYAMMQESWSIDNIAFGSGGALLQKLNRDTQRFAYKCSAIERSSVWHPVSKDPVTAAFKKSKAGRFKLIKNEDNTYNTVDINTVGMNQLKTVFENGEILQTQTLEHIKQRLLESIY